MLPTFAGLGTSSAADAKTETTSNPQQRVILIPLGLVVSTDVRISIASFQSLTDELKLGIKISEVLPTLMGLMQNYNLGVMNESEFEETLIAAIKQLCIQKQLSPAADWQQAWKAKWKAAWNSMCTVTAHTAAIIDLFREFEGFKPVFYVYTNPTHYEHLMPQLKELGISTEQILTSFQAHTSVAQVVANYITRTKDQPCEILLGNPENFPTAELKQNAEQRRIELLSILPESLAQTTVPGTILEVDLLRSVFAKYVTSSPKPTV